MTSSQISATDAAPGVDAHELARHIAEMYRDVATGPSTTCTSIPVAASPRHSATPSDLLDRLPAGAASWFAGSATTSVSRTWSPASACWIWAAAQEMTSRGRRGGGSAGVTSPAWTSSRASRPRPRDPRGARARAERHRRGQGEDHLRRRRHLRRAMPVLIAAFPALRTYLARLGSRQIRTLGTIGGNIGNASPIGDMPPVLLALETRVKLVSRARRARIAAGGVLPRLPQDRAGARRGDPEPHPAAPVAGRELPLRQGQQAARPGYLHGRRRLSPADQERQDRGRAARLRRHGRDAQARQPCRGGAAEGRLRRRARGARAGFPAARRLARHRRLSPAGRGQPAAPAASCASPSRSVRSRSRRYERRRPHLAAPRFGAEACHRPGALYRRHARARRHAACRAGAEPDRARPAAKLDVPAAAPGVVAVLGPDDIPGKNDVPPVGSDEPLFADRPRSSMPASRWRWSWRRRSTRRAMPPSARRSRSSRAEPILDIETALAPRPMSRRRRPCCAAIPTPR